jgi:two-component system, NarL family, sensor kinase
MTTAPGVDAAWSRTVLADRRVSPSDRGQAHEMTKRLIAGSLAGLVLLASAGYLIGARFAERQVVTDARRFSALLANGFVAPRLTPALLAGDPNALEDLDRVIRDRLVPNTSLRRVKIWSADGQILYSDDRREIGKTFRLTGRQREALRTGRTVAAVSDLKRRENEFERRLEPRLLETYTGVRASNGQGVLLETYVGYRQIREHRNAVFRMLSIVVAVGVALFAAFQIMLGRITLRWVRRRQQELDAQAQVVSDRARQRLARDLHDGTVQDLVGASYVVDGVLQSLRGRQLPEAERLLEGAAVSVRHSLQSLRSVMVEVYPRTIHDAALGDALNDLAQPMRTRGLDVDVTVHVSGRLTAETSQALHRAAQETVRNVMHHSKARSAQILVEAPDDREFVLMEIADDGIGMPPGPIESREGHLGLRALTDIVAERNGRLEIWSAPGKGTRVMIEMPR